MQTISFSLTGRKIFLPSFCCIELNDGQGLLGFTELFFFCFQRTEVDFGTVLVLGVVVLDEVLQQVDALLRFHLVDPHQILPTNAKETR